MFGYRRHVGFAALAVAPGVLLVKMLAGSWPNGTEATVSVALLVLTAATVVAERDVLRNRQRDAVLARHDVVSTVTATVLGAVATYVLNVQAGFGPVFASASVGLVVGLAHPPLAVAAYCGSFVGMASPSLFPTGGGVFIAGLAAGVGLAAADGVFDGFGGKLGTLAFAGCLTVAGLTSGLTSATFSPGATFPWAALLVAVPVAALAAISTFLLHARRDWNVVVASAAVGVVAVALRPAFDIVSTAPLAAVAFCASFVGMSSLERFGRGPIVAAGGLSAVVYTFAVPVFGGAGGKLGTTAFVACVVLAGAARVRNWVVP